MQILATGNQTQEINSTLGCPSDFEGRDLLYRPWCNVMNDLLNSSLSECPKNYYGGDDDLLARGWCRDSDDIIEP